MWPFDLFRRRKNPEPDPAESNGEYVCNGVKFRNAQAVQMYEQDERLELCRKDVERKSHKLRLLAMRLREKRLRDAADG